MSILIGESSDNLLRFFRGDRNHPKFIKLNRISLDILQHFRDLDLLVEEDQDTAHEFSGPLVDVYADVLDKTILVEGFFDVLIGKITVDALHVETRKLF